MPQIHRLIPNVPPEADEARRSKLTNSDATIRLGTFKKTIASNNPKTLFSGTELVSEPDRQIFFKSAKFHC